MTDDAKMSNQLPLRIGLRDSTTFENFYTAANQQLLSELRRCSMSQGEHFIFFYGLRGTGKSHCLQAVCHSASKHQLQATYLPMQEIKLMTVDVLDGLERIDVVCIDDIESIAGNHEWEVAIFNLYNRIREAGGRLVVAADTKLDASRIGLKDLLSRLAWGLVFKLESLDDVSLAEALQLRAKMRGMELPDDVATYILKRSSREMNTLFSLLEKLDRESLVEQRKLTIPFVKKHL